MVSLLLDLLHTRQSLWNSKHDSYRNRNIRNGEYEEMLEGLREEMLDLALPALKGELGLKAVRTCIFCR